MSVLSALNKDQIISEPSRKLQTVRPPCATCPAFQFQVNSILLQSFVCLVELGLKKSNVSF